METGQVSLQSYRRDGGGEAERDRFSLQRYRRDGGAGAGLTYSYRGTGETVEAGQG